MCPRNYEEAREASQRWRKERPVGTGLLTQSPGRCQKGFWGTGEPLILLSWAGHLAVRATAGGWVQEEMAPEVGSRLSQTFPGSCPHGWGPGSWEEDMGTTNPSPFSLLQTPVGTPKGMLLEGTG